MRKALCCVLAASIFLAGCAGRTASPIQIQRLGDDRMAEAAIHSEMAQIDRDISAKKRKQDNILTTNIVLGVAGFFVIVPWFFMNLKDAEGTEIEALKQRKTWLSDILDQQSAKDCTMPKISDPVVRAKSK